MVKGAQPPKPVVFRPGKHKLEKGETLVCDESAYDIFYKCNVEWPALSFDYICTDSQGQFNNLNPSKLNAYPLSISLVLGTQANSPANNKLVFVRMSNLHRNPNRKKMNNLTKKQNNNASDSDSEEEEEEEEEDDDDNDDSDSENSDNDDADGKDPITLSNVDMNGIIQNNEIKVDSTINRIRVMPQQSNIIAYWTEKGRVQLVDGNNNLNSLYLDNSSTNKNRMKLPNTPLPSSTKPFYSTRIHGTEGYALDWNRVNKGYLLSGACDGSIYLTKPLSNSNIAAFTTNVDKFRSNSSSVEDIQWSPNESNVFASCSSIPESHINIWDIRQYRKPALTIPYAHNKNVDINVISWNKLESHLLTSGADNGIIKVWDLRTLSSSNSSMNSIQAAAEFSLHKKPITSIQWHPTDASMLCASSEDGSVSIWDLAVERDAEEELRDGIVVDGADEFPPQLLFIHMGQQNVKDAQWHPACPSLIVSTAEDGVNVFQPANIALPT